MPDRSEPSQPESPTPISEPKVPAESAADAPNAADSSAAAGTPFEPGNLSASESVGGAPTSAESGGDSVLEAHPAVEGSAASSASDSTSEGVAQTESGEPTGTSTADRGVS